MQPWKIKDGKMEYYEDEMEKIQEYVSKKKGKILHGFWRQAIEKGDDEINILWYVNKKGICGVPFKDLQL